MTSKIGLREKHFVFILAYTYNVCLEKGSEIAGCVQSDRYESFLRHTLYKTQCEATHLAPAKIKVKNVCLLMCFQKILRLKFKQKINFHEHSCDDVSREDWLSSKYR